MKFKQFAESIVNYLKSNVPAIIDEQVAKSETNLLARIESYSVSRDELDKIIELLRLEFGNDYLLLLEKVEQKLILKGNPGQPGEKGETGKKGEDGNSILDIYIDQRGHLIIVTNIKKYDLGLLITQGSGGGGSISGNSLPFTYSNSLPMPEDVGGLLAGTTFTNMGLNELWTRLLYPFSFPSFTLFTIDGVGPQIESGDMILAGNYNTNWVIINTDLLLANSITIRYITGDITLVSNLPNVSPYSLLLPTITYTVPTTVTFRISAMDTTGETFDLDYVAAFMDRIYIGESNLIILAEIDVKSLRISELSSNINGEYSLLGGGYKWFCYPTWMGTRTDFYDVDNSFPIAMNIVETVSITNDFGVTQDYYCYRTFNILGGSINIGIR